MIPVLQSAGAEGGYGLALLQSIFALAAVCGLAWFVLRWTNRLRLGARSTGQRIEVIERVALEPNRSLYLVRLGDRVLLLGAGERGSPSMLMELSVDELPEVDAPQSAWSRVLVDRMWGRRGS